MDQYKPFINIQLLFLRLRYNLHILLAILVHKVVSNAIPNITLILLKGYVCHRNTTFITCFKQFVTLFYSTVHGTAGLITTTKDQGSAIMTRSCDQNHGHSGPIDSDQIVHHRYFKYET